MFRWRTSFREAPVHTLTALGGAIVFLASEEFAYVTGHKLVVNGGFSEALVSVLMTAAALSSWRSRQRVSVEAP